MNFLIPVDGSPASRRATEFATELLNPDRDTIWLLCVVEAVPISELESGNDGSTVKEEMTQEAKIILEDARTILEGGGYSFETRLAYGDAGESICDFAEEIDADTVILGRQGKGRVEEFILGSVSNYVLHHSSVPVLAVPRPPQ